MKVWRQAGQAAMCSAVLAMVLTGCKHPQQVVPDDLMPQPAGVQQGTAPTYAEVANAYNQRLGGVKQFWSRTKVKVRWENEKGKVREESGEGKLLFVAPLSTAVTVEKLGAGTILWAGSNEERYWLFDLFDGKEAWVGRQENLGSPCAYPLPMPVHPSGLPHMLGLVPLDPQAGPAGQPVEVLQGYYLLEPANLNLRMLIDPATYRAVRIDLVDGDGRSALVTRLEGAVPIETADVAEADWPALPERVSLYMLGEEAAMEVRFTRATDGVVAKPIKPQVFDFATLVKAHKPKEIHVLDERCERPAWPAE